MNNNTVEMLRERLLLARRQALLGLGVAEDDLSWIEQNREIELEERAQDEAASDVLARREEHDYRRVCEIQDALDRISEGTYGVCVSCGETIPTGRLLALPEAAMCADCAEEAEGNWVSEAAARSTREREVEAPRSLRSELVGLSDSEIVAMAEERLRTDVGTALDELRILCRHGAVTLAGETANDELRQIAIRILEEELGLEIVDRVRVRGSAAPQARARAKVSTAATAKGDRADDVFAAAEEGADYTPPARPVAEKE